MKCKALVKAKDRKYGRKKNDLETVVKHVHDDYSIILDIDTIIIFAKEKDNRDIQ